MNGLPSLMDLEAKLGIAQASSGKTSGLMTLLVTATCERESESASEAARWTDFESGMIVSCEGLKNDFSTASA
jgi:hypothetical protein